MPAQNMTAMPRNRIFLKTTLCRFHVQGMCKRGKSCNFAHTQSEMRQLPDLFRTKRCKPFVETGICNNPDCRFAHHRNERRKFGLHVNKPRPRTSDVTGDPGSRVSGSNQKGSPPGRIENSVKTSSTKSALVAVRYASETARTRLLCKAGQARCPGSPTEAMLQTQAAKEPWCPVAQSAQSFRGTLREWQRASPDEGDEVYDASCNTSQVDRTWSRQTTAEPSLEEDPLEELDDLDEASSWFLETGVNDSLDSLEGRGARLDAFNVKPSTKSIFTGTQMGHWPVQWNISIKNTFIHIDEPLSGVFMRRVRSEEALLG